MKIWHWVLLLGMAQLLVLAPLNSYFAIAQHNMVSLACAIVNVLLGGWCVFWWLVRVHVAHLAKGVKS